MIDRKLYTYSRDDGGGGFGDEVQAYVRKRYGQCSDPAGNRSRRMAHMIFFRKSCAAMADQQKEKPSHMGAKPWYDWVFCERAYKRTEIKVRRYKRNVFYRLAKPEFGELF